MRSCCPCCESLLSS